MESSNQIDRSCVVKINGKEFVKYDGLLNLAHNQGLTRLEVEHIQLPAEENGMMAICRAVAQSEEGKVFSDLGDANPNNVTGLIAPHILRMASTRAKARVLRDMCNIGLVCLEELSQIDTKEEASNATYPKQVYPPKPSGSDPSNTVKNGNITEAQVRAIHNLAWRRNLSEDELSVLCQNMDMHCTTIDQLDKRSASNLIKTLQQAG
jgi:hypothetical protein